MQWYTYLYENKIFTNKWDPALFGKGKAWVAGKGKERVGLIKSLIYTRMEKMWLGRGMKDRSEKSKFVSW